MAVKLHRCKTMWVKLDGHPCWRVQQALDEQGVEYEVVGHPWAPWKRDELERLLGGAASSLARRPVQVRCEDVSDGKVIEPGGVVDFNAAQQADYARIRPDVCAAVARFVQRRPRVWGCFSGYYCSPAIVASADALNVLAHESMHLRGIKTEATAECYAIQVLPQLAERLGANDAYGRAAAGVELTRLYPRLPPAYRSSECRPGGTLDMHLGAAWPA